LSGKWILWVLRLLDNEQKAIKISLNFSYLPDIYVIANNLTIMMRLQILKTKRSLLIFRHILMNLVPGCILFTSFLVLNSCNSTSEISFRHHVVANPLPGNEWGTGGFTLADYDKDGDMDVTIQCRSDSDKVYWYEYRNADTWVPHFLGIGKEYQLGATAVDVDRDSNIDLVMGHVWFKNPGDLNTNKDSEWKENFYNGDMKEENHDIVCADINLDGTDEIIMYNQTSSTMRLYDITDPYNWTFTDVSSVVNENDVHSGIFPHGIVDLDNDKYPDAIMPLFWYKNPGKSGGEWVKNEYPYIPILPNPYGKGIRVWAGDINDDGLNDIIYSDCDVQFSKVYLLINGNGGETWKKEEIALPPGNVENSGSFHSLQVADFDNDGDLDIFAGEQEDATSLMKPDSLRERGIIFQNTGTIKKPSFTPIIINEDNPGWHDALIGDVDGDGDIDILSKVWNADTPIYHLDYWENELIK
jgi:FG-GAP-like repeat